MPLPPDQWDILYRGPLSNCNYACPYCPFAKTINTLAELAEDKAQLTRFLNWVEARPARRIGILITPWGEALIHRYYREALIRLSHLPHVYRAAIQTNLSAPLDSLAEADPATLALWCTWHPGEVSRERFLRQCQTLDRLGLRYSVGVVGAREILPELESLRAALPPRVYLWVNAMRAIPGGYTAEELALIERADPLFAFNHRSHRTLGRACRAGHQTFTLDGEGNLRRCHFIKAILGNIYRDDPEALLHPRPCSNAECHCHIGYVHLADERLDLHRVFGDGLLERLPALAGWQETAAAMQRTAWTTAGR